MAVRSDANRRNNPSRKTRPQRSPKLRSSAGTRRSGTERREPPVLTRHAVADMPVRKLRRRSKTRRRYDMPRGANGVEVRLPSMPRIALGWRLASAFLVAFLGYALYLMWTSPEYRVEQAQISGLVLQKEEDVNRVLDAAGQPIFAIDPLVMQERLQVAFPEFSHVEMAVQLPNTVQVTVTERVPVLAWKQDERVQLIDQDGVSFPVRSDGPALPSVQVAAKSPPPPLTVPQGLDESIEQAQALDLGAKPFISSNLVQAILTLSSRAPAGVGLIYDAQHGLGWNDPNGWVVYFGDSQDMEMKLNVYDALVAHLQAEMIYPVFISVEYVHAPYYRLEP